MAKTSKKSRSVAEKAFQEVMTKIHVVVAPQVMSLMEYDEFLDLLQEEITTRQDLRAGEREHPLREGGSR